MREYRGRDCSHLVLRGESRRYVFADEILKQKLLMTADRVQKEGRMVIYAFCILDEEAHFLICIRGEQQAREMADRIADQFTSMIQRETGLSRLSLIREVFFDEADWEDLLTACISIHLLPQKRKCARRFSDYYWTSYREFLHSSEGALTAAGEILEYLDPELGRSRQKFIALHKQALANL